jgi:hypothetical protein
MTTPEGENKFQNYDPKQATRQKQDMMEIIKLLRGPQCNFKPQNLSGEERSAKCQNQVSHFQA